MRKGKHILTFMLIVSLAAPAGVPSADHAQPPQPVHPKSPAIGFRFPETRFLDKKLEALAEFFLTRVVPDERRRLDSTDEEMDQLYAELDSFLPPNFLMSDALVIQKFMENVRARLSAHPSEAALKMLRDFARATLMSKAELAREMSALFASGTDKERLFIDRLVWAHYLQLFKKALPTTLHGVSVPMLISLLDEYLREPEKEAARQITRLVEILGGQAPDQLMQIVGSVVAGAHDWRAPQKNERVATLNLAFRFLSKKYKVADICRAAPKTIADTCVQQATHGIQLAERIRDGRKGDEREALEHLHALVDIKVEPTNTEGMARLRYSKRTDLSPADFEKHLKALREALPLLNAMGSLHDKDNPWGVSDIDLFTAIFTAWEQPDKTIRLAPPHHDEAGPAAVSDVPGWARDLATPPVPPEPSVTMDRTYPLFSAPSTELAPPPPTTLLRSSPPPLVCTPVVDEPEGPTLTADPEAPTHDGPTLTQPVPTGSTRHVSLLTDERGRAQPLATALGVPRAACAPPPTVAQDKAPASPASPPPTGSQPKVADRSPAPADTKDKAPAVTDDPGRPPQDDIVARSSGDLRGALAYNNGRSILDETGFRAPRQTPSLQLAGGTPPNYGDEFRLPTSPTQPTAPQGSPPVVQTTPTPAAPPPRVAQAPAPPPTRHRPPAPGLRGLGPQRGKGTPRGLPFGAPRAVVKKSPGASHKGGQPGEPSSGGEIEQVSRTTAPAFQAMPNYANESALPANSRSIGREPLAPSAQTVAESEPAPPPSSPAAPILGSVASNSGFVPDPGVRSLREGRRPASAPVPVPVAAIPVSVPVPSDYGKPGAGVTFGERKERFVAEKPAVPAAGAEDLQKGIEETRETTSPSTRLPGGTEKVVERIVRNKNVTRTMRKKYERDSRGALVALTETTLEVQFSYEGTTEIEDIIKRDPTTLEEKERVHIVRFKQAGKILNEDKTVTTFKKPGCPTAKVQTIDPKSLKGTKTVITTSYNASCQEVKTVKTTSNSSADAKRATATVAPSVSIKVPKRMPQALFGP